MRSILMFSAVAGLALMASGCRLAVSRSGDCGIGDQRCSTQFQERCVNGVFRPFQGMRGGVSGVSGCGCDQGSVSGCGCDNGGGGTTLTDSGCGCNENGGGTASSGLWGGGMGGGRLGGGLQLPALSSRNGGCLDGDCGGMAQSGNGFGMSDNVVGIGSGYTGDDVALAGYHTGHDGCGRFGCGDHGRLCLSCRLRGLHSGGRWGGRGTGLLHKAIPNGMQANHPYGGQIPHTEPMAGGMGPEGQTPTYAYPYYSLRGPRDFLQANPPTIGY